MVIAKYAQAAIFSLACYGLAYWALGVRGVIALILICFGILATSGGI